MSNLIINIATGRNKISIYFLVIFMFLAPVAVFTNYKLLDAIAWIMLIILGIFIVITGFVTLQEAKESIDWPKAEANNLECSLKSTTNNGVTSYAPHIQCKFNVDGKEYSGTEFDFSSTYTTENEANNKLDAVKAMNPLIIYYKPSTPSINVINPGVYSVPYVRVVLGFLMVVMPILFWSGVIVLK